MSWNKLIYTYAIEKGTDISERSFFTLFLMRKKIIYLMDGYL
jgi:hypothetical protein